MVAPLVCLLRVSLTSPWRQRVGALGLAAAFGVLAWQAATRSVDFPIYHRIGGQLLAGDYAIYPPAVFDGGQMPPHGWRYLPVTAALFVPLALLPLQWAALLFFMLKVAAIGYAGRVLMRRAGVPETWSLPLMALLLVAGFVVEEIRYGNAHLFVVALMVLAFDRVERGAVLGPSIALAVAIAIKITPLALLGYFALRRRVAVCAGTVIALGGLAIAPAAVVGFDANGRLLHAFVRYAIEKTTESDNYSLKGVLDRAFAPSASPEHSSDPTTVAAGTPLLFAPTMATWVWVVMVASIGIATLAVLWTTPPRWTVVPWLELSLVLSVALIVSPHTQRRYFSQLFVPALALLCARRLTPSIARGPSALGLGAVAITGTLLPLVFGGPRLAKMYESASPYVYGAFVLACALMVVITRSKRVLHEEASLPPGPPPPVTAPRHPVAARTQLSESRPSAGQAGHRAR